MTTNVWLITAMTNLHAGDENTSSYGIIDNTVQRDTLTQLPCINSSSLKGAINEFCCQSKMPGEVRKRIFGSDKMSNDKSASSKGTSFFFDAKILFLPVQDDTSLYHYATCNDVLTLFEERLATFGRDIHLDKTPDALKSKFNLDKNVCIVDSKKFDELCDNENLPIIARNVLENGISRNLWYEQVLPPKTVLYTVTRDENDSLKEYIDGKLIQIGANATIGYGFCKFSSFK